MMTKQEQKDLDNGFAKCKKCGVINCFDEKKYTHNYFDCDCGFRTEIITRKEEANKL